LCCIVWSPWLLLKKPGEARALKRGHLGRVCLGVLLFKEVING
jgi:hypothetical protein